MAGSYTAVVVLLFIANTLLFHFLIAEEYHDESRFNIFSNSSLNSTAMLNMRVYSHTDCLLRCSTLPRCLSVNIMKKAMAHDGRITCDLFDMTHISPDLNLVASEFFDHYKTKNFKDCFEANRTGSTTAGVHKLQHRNGTRFDAYCDMETDGGGWTVIQKRFEGAVDFSKPWVDYKKGFGDVNGEYWLGLDAMHELTESGTSTLRVDMWDNGDYAFAVYSNVKISNETQGYRLDYEALIDGTSISEDSLVSGKGKKFSTYDQDNDTWEYSCSNTKGNAGWWFGHCTWVNPNGFYTPGTTSSNVGVYWKSFRGKYYSLQKIELKLRRQ